MRRTDPLPLGGVGGLPYSRGLMARALVAAGVAPLPAYALALRAGDDLRERGARTVELERLQELAVEVLGDDEGLRTVHRLRRYERLQRLEVPIILLVGGATGTGKSTVATDVAHRLGITRVTSTDFIRQTMRAYFAREFMPSIHYSSFEAGDALPAAGREAGDPLRLGFLDQTRNVLVGAQAALERSLEEGWSTVLEGVHLVPGMLALPRDDALVVHVVLSVMDEPAHAQHFWVRDASTGGTRPLAKYLARLGEIRHVQDFIVGEARKVGVPVIDNGGMDAAVGDVLDLVYDRAEEMEVQLA